MTHPQYEAFRAARSEANHVEKLRVLLTDNKVPESDRDFASSLLRSADTRGLSLKQSAWIDKLVERFSRPAPVAPTTTALPSCLGVTRLLTRARENGLKYPKLWLRLMTDSLVSDLRITVAGDKSRTPGHLVLTDGESFGNNRYFGKISPEGTLTIGRDGAAVQTALVDLLTRLAQDPAKVAAEFGHLTGHCCFCSLELSDERSTSVGYGKRCAEKYDLPWGSTDNNPLKSP